MNKSLRQQALHSGQVRRTYTAKFSSYDGFAAAALNPRVKKLLAEVPIAQPNRYMVIQVDPQLAQVSEQ